MTAFFDSLLHIYQNIPFPLVVCLLGWAISIGVTQPLKFALPLNWYPQTRQVITQSAAFVSAFVTVFSLLGDGIGVVLGIVVGLWSPLAYALAIKLIEYRYPFLADVLSGDVRGMLKGDVRENRPDPVKPPRDAVP